METHSGYQSHIFIMKHLTGSWPHTGLNNIQHALSAHMFRIIIRTGSSESILTAIIEKQSVLRNIMAEALSESALSSTKSGKP